MDILERIAAQAAQQGMHLSEVSERIGKPKQYLSNALKHRNPDGSRRDPRFSTVVALCKALNITPDALLGHNTHAPALPVPTSQDAEELIASVTTLLRQHLPGMRDTPSFQDVLQWWHVEGGRIERLGRLKEYFDIYEAPNSDGSILKVHDVGYRSLASRKTGNASTQRVQGMVNLLDANMAKRVNALHRKCQSGVICANIEIAELEVPDTEQPLDLTYSRLLLPIVDQKGNRFTLNYSQEISFATA